MKRVCLSFVVTALALVPVSSFAQGTTAAPKATAPAAAAKGGGTAGRTVEITATDTTAPAPNNKLAFSVTTINAKPGERITVVLKAVGTMPKMASSHNFVLFKPGTKPADVDAFLSAAMMAGATDYIPADKKAMVLANTKMTAGGETSQVTFTAPTAPGTYTYVCTFPAHAASGMKGTLIVK